MTAHPARKNDLRQKRNRRAGNANDESRRRSAPRDRMIAGAGEQADRARDQPARHRTQVALLGLLLIGNRHANLPVPELSPAF